MNAGIEFRTLDEMIDVLAPNTPHALVLDSWRRLERTIDDYSVVVHECPRPRQDRYIPALRDDPRIGPFVAEEIDGLRRRRNEVAHGGGADLAPDEAAQFARRSLDLIGVIGCAVPDDLAMPTGADRLG